MGRVKQVEIKESAEELLKQSRRIKNPLAQARLRAFYLYKTGQVTEYDKIAKEVGYERHAIGQWFSLYREKGLEACLDLNMGGRPEGSLIKGKALEELIQKLSDSSNYF